MLTVNSISQNQLPIYSKNKLNQTESQNSSIVSNISEMPKGLNASSFGIIPKQISFKGNEDSDINKEKLRLELRSIVENDNNNMYEILRAKLNKVSTKDLVPLLFTKGSNSPENDLYIRNEVRTVIKKKGKPEDVNHLKHLLAGDSNGLKFIALDLIRDIGSSENIPFIKQNLNLKDCEPKVTELATKVMEELEIGKEALETPMHREMREAIEVIRNSRDK